MWAAACAGGWGGGEVQCILASRLPLFLLSRMQCEAVRPSQGKGNNVGSEWLDTHIRVTLPGPWFMGEGGGGASHLERGECMTNHLESIE